MNDELSENDILLIEKFNDRAFDSLVHLEQVAGFTFNRITKLIKDLVLDEKVELIFIYSLDLINLINLTDLTENLILEELKNLAKELNVPIIVTLHCTEKDEHVDNGIPKLESFVVTVDEVENSTGIDFFTFLDDKIENELEKSLLINKWF